MAPKNFHHPFQPYDIQQQFMEAVYNCIEQGTVGIFESPTGTGKSLSLICGSLTWLREHKRRQFDESLAAIQLEDDEPEWMVEHAKDERRREIRQLRADLEARLEAVRQKEKKVRQRNANGEPPAKRRKHVHEEKVGDGEDEDQYLLDDYNSDEEDVRQVGGGAGFSSETTKLMEKLGMYQSVDNKGQTEETPDELKVFFCSRTHSQLSQFVGELKRVKLPPGLPPEEDDAAASEALKQLTLGSRKNLCINSKVSKLSSQTAINERCIELQQPSTPAEHKCPFLPKKDDQETVLDFRDHALASIRDIEDLAAVGTKLQVCPYYASRTAIDPAEMVTLPYPLLLQRTAREALGVSLKGHVVIIDEAHNLMDAIEGIYSAQVTQLQLSKAKESLMTYLQKFRNRLKGSNRMYVTQVVRVIDSLLLPIMHSTSQESTPVQPDALLSGKGVDQVNLAKLVRYINDSKLARKVECYITHTRVNEKTESGRDGTTTADVPTLTHVQNFLMCLTNPSKEGRFFMSKEQNTTAIRYLLLDPSEHFREVVEDARAVILAGGTMSPMDDYKQQLFPYFDSISTLSCGHLIPASNLLVRTIASDADGPLEFSFKSRSNPATPMRVGQALLNIAPSVKAGLVVFLPSYSYLEQLLSTWREKRLLDSLKKLKPVFTDSRGGSAENTFQAYSQAISTNPNGAILLSVIGGKLSEGINFSDDLGRCVVVVGLPFPNLETPEWKAKMQYLEEKAVARGQAKGSASREYAENVCMRSVNQAIGRVIRHKDDWASILLMDSRYEQGRIRSKLPGWIKECMPERSASSVREVGEHVEGFFRLKETAAEENATSYFPLLDRIAEGYFDSIPTDQALYTRFRKLLKQDGHLVQEEDLSSFDLALSIHSAAPRIEAHYQYYNTSVKPTFGSDSQEGCETWLYVPFSGQRYCSPELDATTAQPLGKAGEPLHQLPFDRILGDAASEQPSILYGDITSESFRKFHKTISQTAKGGKTSYRVRYQPSTSSEVRPLTVSGYGVELALKRTDYIVIDDRTEGEEASEGTKQAGEAILSEEEVSDLRPLSASELVRLGMKAATFVMNSEAPFDTLVRLSQDFPKHSGAIAAVNVSKDFIEEHISNREQILPSGFNVLWVNGVQIVARDLDAYSLLEHLRRERKMINGVRELGLSGAEAIDLLSHEAITESQVEQSVQRHDWRDESEGGEVIMWLNDIEKDKRYAEWPSSVSALLQRTYPGQLPPVRRDIHNLIIPIDFSSYADVTLVVENIQMFVKRTLPIRFGLVPLIKSPAGEQQAKAVYHLLDTYGLAAALSYLENSLEAAGRKFGAPQSQQFEDAVEGRKVRHDSPVMGIQQVLEADSLETRIESAAAYLKRLGVNEATPTIFINGVPIQRSDDWLQQMSTQLTRDNRALQQAVYETSVGEEDYLPNVFLAAANLRRVPLVVPEDDKDIRHLDLGDLPEFAKLPSLPANADTIERELVHMTVIADLDTLGGLEQIMEAWLFQREHDNVELAFLHNPSGPIAERRFASVFGEKVDQDFMSEVLDGCDMLVAEDKLASEHLKAGDAATFDQREEIYRKLYFEGSSFSNAEVDQFVVKHWAPFRSIVQAGGLQQGQGAVIFNGRVVGPIEDSTILEVDGLEALYTYERKKRLLPASLAIQALGLESKASSPFSFAKISNLIALSQVSDVPEGIFEAPPTVRSSVFKKWKSDQTAIKVGDKESASIQIVGAIDPASEVAQRWIPIIKTLSELSGVYTTLYLNPRERLEEIPIKRFYRHVLGSKPTFGEDGSLKGISAHFAGLPAEALLNMGMDLPPSWLVAPKETVHDLDNIKLSAVRSGSDIEATYELEHILIEGHSRDITIGPPPRGAQLVLGTELDPHSADTIIMANLGYFQFKGNPGVYNLALQQGRSEEIFHIDSAGTQGYSPQPGDNGTEIALMSFRGATLFPRLSRKPGMEEEDVLEPSKSALESMADGADKLLAQAGLKGSQASKYLSKASKLGSSFFHGAVKSTDISTEVQADINIFSVASGHLYERMLNIMMVSVMKHTKHTVKFWFIEQFLSPSFKDFLPIMAEEYGFRYEMVAYKWPHWLRAQKEKQREIWGYKILFLDVLFPLDLDKVIFVDADQIVRTDMYELVQHDLKGAPYGFTPMCDSRTEMEGFRFWKQGYWKNFLRGLPYHISALYVVDLKKFRQIAAGDRLRGQYQQLSADPASLSNLDQDLPNHMQMVLPIHSLPQEWLWCETWCSDEALRDAKTIDLCNNPQTKEPKLDRARRQVPEWTVYDDEIAAVAKRRKVGELADGKPVAGQAADAGVQGEEESIQERLQREDAEREWKKKEHIIDEL
ncbi:killer toxin resistant protein [Saxophila tyrrhenica]|uniref:ATP-dependent DNA helicase CHL1 n=1 Tax=Saxophila tyrrhenica TaxID=1690608 RepID=A0AAV9PB63_9PEZI|nr:killer toxin resistant protein [Saxophila tyrrhenica]